MHTTHLAYISDKENQAKKSAYHRAKQQTQAKLREMKNNYDIMVFMVLWYFTGKMHQIRFLLGLRLDLTGELTALTQTP